MSSAEENVYVNRKTINIKCRTQWILLSEL